MKHLCMAVAVVFSAIFNAQQKKTDLQNLNLKGKVKSVETREYLSEVKNGKAVKNGLFAKYIQNFTPFGNISEYIYYDNGETIGLKNITKYDKNHKKLEESAYIYPSGKLDNKTTYIYDKQGNNTEIIGYLGNEFLYKDTLKYDEKGNLVERKDAEGTHYYKYDAQNNMTEHILNDTENEVLSKFHYKYDDQSHQIEEIEEVNGLEVKKILNNYDIQGNISQIYVYEIGEKENLLISNTTYLYEYDTQGNWTTMTMFENGQALSIIEQTIKYY